MICFNKLLVFGCHSYLKSLTFALVLLFLLFPLNFCFFVDFFDKFSFNFYRTFPLIYLLYQNSFNNLQPVFRKLFVIVCIRLEVRTQSLLHYLIYLSERRLLLHLFPKRICHNYGCRRKDRFYVILFLLCTSKSNLLNTLKLEFFSDFWLYDFIRKI